MLDKATVDAFRDALTLSTDDYDMCKVCHNFLAWRYGHWNGHQPLGHTDYCAAGPLLAQPPAEPSAESEVPSE